MKRSFVVLAVLLALAIASCTNDPFDPDSVTNQIPVVSFFVESIDPDDEFNPTSYYQRQFHWSGADADGRIEEFYVAIRTNTEPHAPWTTTTRTDTIMTFVPDSEGLAEAIFHLACRDDRGAYSDTLVRRLPMRNSPPVLNFQSDYDPRVNFQREFVMEGGAVVDTVYWNWGVNNVRCFAFDLDGNATMDDFYRYTMADTDPTVVRMHDDSTADPLLHWIQVPFDSVAEIIEFEIIVKDLPPGERTLTVTVSDEANTESRLTLNWQVRAPRGPMLVVADNAGPPTNEFYAGFLDSYFGPEGWDRYDFWFGFPDKPDVLLETLRKFEGVFWYNSGGASVVLQRATERDGVLSQYISPIDDSEPGKFFMASKGLTGNSSGLPAHFRQQFIGIGGDGDPPAPLVPNDDALGAQALSVQAHLPAMTIESLNGGGIGLIPNAGTEVLYQFEECNRCFGPRQSNQPIIAVRLPDRTAQPLANVVGVSFDLQLMNFNEAWASLAAILEYELGVVAP